MKQLLRSLLLALLLVAPAAAQVPSTLPANTVVGRLGVIAGPPQAVPVTSLLSAASQSPANQVFAGPTSGGSGAATFRSLLFADFPTIAAGTLIGNPTGSSAVPQAFTIPSLVNLSSPNSTLDFLLIYDHSTGQLKYASPSQLQGAVALSTNNTWTGDNLFASGRPWCDVRAKGAVGDGVTDDTAAFAACITELTTTYAAGEIRVPPSAGAYCLFSGISINTGLTTNGGIILRGTGVQGSILSACGHNITVVTINDQWAQIRNLSIYGYGVQATDAVFTGTAPTLPAVLLGTGCSNCRIQDDYIIGGTAAVQNNGACGYTLDNVWGSFSYGDGSHVFGFFSQINCGGTIWNSHFDMVYPVSQPAHGTAISAWTNAHAYTSGTIVSVTCNSRTFYVQAANAGTSGGSFPGCSPFGAYSKDNVTGTCPSPSVGVCWLLVNAATSYGIQIDTGSIETEINQTDATCACNYNIAYTNTYAGTAPTQNRMSFSTPGGGFSGNILVDSGSHLTMTNMETSFCLATGCAAVLIDNAVVSIVNITGIDCLNSFAYCIDITAGASHILVSQMHATGGDTADFNVSAAATGFELVNSEHVSGSANLFTIGSVAADHYIITNNICNGGSSSDSGSGTHKTVTACSGSGP